MPDYKIADLKVHMDCESEMLLSRGRPYEVEDDSPVDINLVLTEKKIKYYNRHE